MMKLEAPKIDPELLINDILETEIGTIYFYDNIVVMEAKEDSLLSIRTGLSILLNCVKIIGTRPVVYISNRINNYAVDPNDYKFLELVPNLKGIAIVSYSPTALATSKLEARFFRKPFQTFMNMKDATNWANQILHGEVI